MSQVKVLCASPSGLVCELGANVIDPATGWISATPETVVDSDFLDEWKRTHATLAGPVSVVAES